MGERASISSLPKNMAERAVFARNKFREEPESIDFDDELLPWVYDSIDNLWYSFDGNYSTYSPQEKREKAAMYKARKEEAEQKAIEIHINTLAWSRIRDDVLKRDDYSCQMCGAFKTTKLHIHHILKRKEGGGDFLDNLLTLCPKCHRAADTKLYDPDWCEGEEQ